MSLIDDLAAVITEEFCRAKIDRVCDEGHEERFATIAAQAIAERLEQGWDVATGDYYVEYEIYWEDGNWDDYWKETKEEVTSRPPDYYRLRLEAKP